MLDACVESSREVLAESHRQPSDHFLDAVVKENDSIANQEAAAILGMGWDRATGLTVGAIAGWFVTDQLLRQIDNLISQSDIESWTNAQLKDQIQNLSGFSASRATQLADNALNYVAGKSARRVAGMTGATEKMSETVGDDHVCPQCEENQADGWIPIGQVFSGSGTEDTPHHPNCRCSVTYQWAEVAQPEGALV